LIEVGCGGRHLGFGSAHVPLRRRDFLRLWPGAKLSQLRLDQRQRRLRLLHLQLQTRCIQPC
jgi:hypothetical protein